MVGNVLNLAMSQNAAGYDISLREYFARIRTNLGIKRSEVGRSAFCQARQKLDWKAFEFLLELLCREFETLHIAKRWKGHRVLGVDGTRVTLPNCSDTNREEFYPSKAQQESGQYPFALLVTAFDVFNGLFVRGTARSCNSDERESLVEMLKHFKVGDLFVLDRGFNGFAFMSEISGKNQHFLMRLCAGPELHWESYVRSFLESGLESDLFEIDGETYDGYTDEPLKVRLILNRSGPEPLLLATSLLDERKYSNEELAKLYRKRWEIEGAFNRLKNLFNVESFHARTGNGILQEIFANLICLSLTSIYTVLANRRIDRPRSRKYDIYPNFKGAVSVLREQFHIFIEDPRDAEQIRQHLDRLEVAIARITCQKQPDRHYPRISKQPLNKWQSKRGAHRKSFEKMAASIAASP